MKRAALVLSLAQPAWADSFLFSNGVYQIVNVPGANRDTTVAEDINNKSRDCRNFFRQHRYTWLS